MVKIKRTTAEKIKTNDTVFKKFINDKIRNNKILHLIHITSIKITKTVVVIKHF